MSLLNKSDYRTAAQAQGHACAICRAPSRLLPKRLSVDHDHATGEVRGLLCSSCNLALGLFEDSPFLLRQAAEYLEVEGDLWDRLEILKKPPSLLVDEPQIRRRRSIPDDRVA